MAATLHAGESATAHPRLAAHPSARNRPKPTTTWKIRTDRPITHAPTQHQEHNPTKTITADSIGGSRLSDERITEVQTAARAQLERAQTAFGSDRLAPAAVLPGTAIVVDDGIATGATVQAAIAVLRARGVATIVVAAPVASPDSARMLQAEADDVVVPLLPADFQAVGQYYRNFHQLSDDDVRACLADLRTSDSP